MSTPSPSAIGGQPTHPSSEFVLLRTEQKPVKFRGWLLGTGTLVSDWDEAAGRNVTRVRLFRTESGKYIWHSERFPHDATAMEEDPSYPGLAVLERAETVVVDRPSRLAAMSNGSALVWNYRPAASKKLQQASLQAWHQAANVDPLIQESLYEDPDAE